MQTFSEDCVKVILANINEDTLHEVHKKITDNSAQALQAAGDAPVGDPHQIAALAVFLGSDESSFLDGDIIKADGGWTV